MLYDIAMDNVLLLSKLVSSGNLPHALLFTGVSGAGKNEMALALARWLFHGAGEFGEFVKRNCACESCEKISKGIHPDFILLDKSPVQIEAIRSLKNKFYSSPFFSDRKIAIITNAEFMRVEAANSLLKILEEPPGIALIILIAPFRSSVLPTIASRALEIRFRSTLPRVPGVREAAQVLTAGSLSEKFAIAKRYNLENKSELLRMLDLALVKMRDGLLRGYDKNNLYAIKKFLAVKKIISTTNASPGLLLEEAFLNSI